MICLINVEKLLRLKYNPFKITKENSLGENIKLGGTLDAETMLINILNEQLKDDQLQKEHNYYMEIVWNRLLK